MLHHRGRGSGDHHHGRVLALPAASQRRLVDDEEDEGSTVAHRDDADPGLSPPRIVDPFRSSHRHLHLHSYDHNSRRVGFVEVKIGGHPLDYKRTIDEESQRTKRPRGPLKMAVVMPTWSSQSQSQAFEAREKQVLVYAPVKIGGHALDHVRFFDKGKPSRPLWGYAGPRIMFTSSSSSSLAAATMTANPQRLIEQVRRGLANLYDCSRCQRIRQSPRVQLCCGHALCASCLSSDVTGRHGVAERTWTAASSSSSSSSSAAGYQLLECVVCDDYIAMEAVVFSPDRVFSIPQEDGGVRSLKELRRQDKAGKAPSSSSSSLNWTSGSAMATLALVAVAAGRRQVTRSGRSHRAPPPVAVASCTQPEQPLAAADPPSSLDGVVAYDIRMEDGPARWQKRVRSLRAPSKLLKYSFVRTLGVGNFAEVMLVRNRKGVLCVLKESDKLQEAVNEIHLLSKISHQNVVRIAEYFVEEIGHRHFAYIEMEYCDEGDLLHLLTTRGAMDPSKFNQVFHQLCRGLAEIHARGIIHRDLKPGNVLLTSDGVAKVADFGVSTFLESDLLTHHAAGTLAFMAPEVRRYFLGETVSYDMKADIWSLGALAVAMLSGDPEPRVATRTVDQVVDELKAKWTGATTALTNQHETLLRRTLDADPNKRPSLNELLEMVGPTNMNARL